MSYMADYVEYLLTRFVKPHFGAGCKEVHVVFDNPGSLNESPKEQSRRDTSAKTTKPAATHECLPFRNTLWTNADEADLRVWLHSLTIA